MDWPGSLIATHSGLRGRSAVDLTPDVVAAAVRSLIELLRERDVPLSLGVARDERLAGEELARAVVRAATAAGADVVDFGVISTPTAKLAARLSGLGGAVVVTGSHLGPEWCGLKLVAAPDYRPIDVRRLPPAGAGASRRLGRVSLDGAAPSQHAAAIAAAVDAEAIHARRLTVHCQGGAGATGALVLAALGCRTDGLPDVGLRLDPDGDRVELVDERGTVLDSEVVLPLAALAEKATAVVKGADTSRMVDDLVPEVHVVSPGELHLVEGLAATGAELAGEGNGGLIVPRVGRTRDGLAAAALVLGLMALSGRPLSVLAGELPRYSRLRSVVPCSDPDEARRRLHALAARLGVDAPVNPEDGIRLEREGVWLLARRSATEPVLRLTVEARDPAAAQALQTEALAGLGGRPS